ncbi:MAG: TIM barrel protein [Pyrinomonadaceae bacterium]
MLKVDLNISILLKEFPFINRFGEAAKLGFKAVEFYWDETHDAAQIAEAVSDTGLEVAAFNLDAGDLAAGDRGLLNDPERAGRMSENLEVAIGLAKETGCTRLTALAGNLRPDEDREKQLEYIRSNLKLICGEAEKAGITVMVEAINGFDNKYYPFTNTRETLEFIDSVGASNLKYLYDIYHMQRMEGNITQTLKENIDRIAHIQIADSPMRNHPGRGEINYLNVLKTIESCGYQGSVGLEFIADGTTAENLAWLPEEHRSGIDLNTLEL